MEITDFLKTPAGIALIVRAVGYGLVLAAAIAFFVSSVSRKTVKSVIAAGALSRDTAKTAEELGLKGPFQRFVMRDGSSVRKTVKKAPADSEEDAARYYIPEDKADGAEIRYVKRLSPVTWLVGSALLAALTEAAVRFVPWILGLFR